MKINKTEKEARMAKKEKNKANELYITRVYDAPVEMVWNAFTDLKHLANWWGPRGFTITNQDKDLREGGHWKFIMHGPDGVDYPNEHKYYEVVKNKKLVYDHGGQNVPPLFRVEVEFTELNGKTQMEMTMALATAEAAREIKKFIKQASGESTWDRLGEYLEKEVHHREKFMINRTFNVSREMMYEMWSNKNHFGKWLAPTGFEMEFIRAEIRPGGESFYCMYNEQLKMYGKVEYLTMTRPSEMCYVQWFVDEKEMMSRHPMLNVWPEKMLTRVTFAEEGPQQTRVTVEWQPHGVVTTAELEQFIAAKAGMTMGWTGSFDKLENYIENHFEQR